MATNTKYKLQGWQQIQITGLATNTKYRAGNKTELDQSQSLGLAAFLPEQPVEFHLHSCQNNRDEPKIEINLLRPHQRSTRKDWLEIYLFGRKCSPRCFFTTKKKHEEV